MSKRRKLRTYDDVRRSGKYKDAIIIDNWKHLRSWYSKHGPSKTHEIVFTEYAAHIKLRRDIPERDKKDATCFYYLSTHAFYGKRSWLWSTEALYSCGFTGIIIRNWDAEEEGEEWPEETWESALATNEKLEVSRVIQRESLATEYGFNDKDTLVPENLVEKLNELDYISTEDLTRVDSRYWMTTSNEGTTVVYWDIGNNWCVISCIVPPEEIDLFT